MAGEELKVRVYTGQVDAYKSEVEATGIGIEALKSQADVKLAQNEESIRVYEANLKKYDVLIKAKLDEVKTLAESYGYETRAFGDVVGAETAVVNANISLFREEVNKAVAQANIAIKEVELDQDGYLKVNDLVINTMNAMAQVTAQMMASLYNTVSNTVSLGFSDTRSQGKSDGWSYSMSEAV